MAYDQTLTYDRSSIRHPNLVPNTIQVPTFLLDEIMPKITNATTKVMFFLVRKIYGWGKESDMVSVGQIMKGTGLSKKSVGRAVNELVEAKVLLKENQRNKKDGNLPSLYAFNERLPSMPLAKFFHEPKKLTTRSWKN